MLIVGLVSSRAPPCLPSTFNQHCNIFNKSSPFQEFHLQQLPPRVASGMEEAAGVDGAEEELSQPGKARVTRQRGDVRSAVCEQSRPAGEQSLV